MLDGWGISGRSQAYGGGVEPSSVPVTCPVMGCDNDRVTIAFFSQNPQNAYSSETDEIKMFYDCIYLSPCESVWRIFGFEINFHDPTIERLSFHLLICKQLYSLVMSQ